MLKRIIVGVDGRPGGRDALALVEAIAPRDAELELVHVRPEMFATGHEADAALEGRARRDAETILAEVAADATRPVTTEAIRSTSPARGLHDHAERTGADLVAVGRSAHPSLGPIVLGDTARAVLHAAPCAVMLVPSGDRERPTPVRALVGYDGRPESVAALEVGEAIARDARATLRVVIAVTPPAPFSPPDAWAFDFEAVVDERCRRAREELAELGRDVEGEAIPGSPADVLERAAADSDLVIVGSRGYGPLRRVVLGSTSDHVALHAPCAVLVVPRLTARQISSGTMRMAPEGHSRAQMPQPLQ